VYIATFPKSGTTWVSEIVWQIFLNGEEDKRPIGHRVHYLDHVKRNYSLETKREFHNFYQEVRPPRVFKAHLPYDRMPLDKETKPKVIYVVRNPKDVAVSLYWHYKGYSFFEFDRSWDEFFELFINGKLFFGSWFEHVLGWWSHRDEQNILFLKYEDLKKNLPNGVKKVAKFLNKELTDDTIERIAKQTCFDMMQSKDTAYMDGVAENESNLRKTGPAFFRKGTVGDWRGYFNEEQNKRFDKLYEEKISGVGLNLEF